MKYPDVFEFWRGDYAYNLWKKVWEEYKIPFPYDKKDFTYKISHFRDKSGEPVQMIEFGFPEVRYDGDIEMMIIIRPVREEFFLPVYIGHITINLIRQKNRWHVWVDSTKGGYNASLGFHRRSIVAIRRMVRKNYDVLLAATQMVEQRMIRRKESEEKGNMEFKSYLRSNLEGNGYIKNLLFRSLVEKLDSIMDGESSDLIGSPPKTIVIRYGSVVIKHHRPFLNEVEETYLYKDKELTKVSNDTKSSHDPISGAFFHEGDAIIGVKDEKAYLEFHLGMRYGCTYECDIITDSNGGVKLGEEKFIGIM